MCCKRFVFVLTFLSFLFITCSPEEEINLPPGNLKGQVLNAFDQPLDGVKVTADDRSVYTDSQGGFTLLAVPAGNQSVAFEKEGYISFSESVEILSEQNVQMNVSMPSGETILDAADTMFTFPASGGKQSLRVESNTSWVLQSVADWIEVDKTTGSGIEKLEFTVSQNTTDTPRESTATLTAGDLVMNLHFIQDNALKILSVEPVINNSKLEIADSVVVRFSKPVSSARIESLYMFCQTNMGLRLLDGGRSVMFSYACGDLGGEYPFRLTTSEGTFEFKVGFYTKKIDLPGRLLDYAVDEEDQSYWVLSFDTSPNKLTQLSMEDLSVIRQFDLPVETRGFALNHFRNEIYLFTYEHPLVSVIGKTDGAFKRDFVIPGDGDDHPQYPEIYPYDMEFTANGVGIVLLQADGSSARSWKVIDSRSGDEVTIHANIINHPYFKSVHVNYDGSRLFLTGLYGSRSITSFYQDDQALVRYMPSGSRGEFIRPNRVNNNIYAGQLYEQMILNPDNHYVSLLSYIDNRNGGDADFVYQQGKEEMVYFVDDDYIQVMDYSTQNTLFWYDVIRGLDGTTATTDGKKLIFYFSAVNYDQGTSEYLSSVFLIDTSWFEY